MLRALVRRSPLLVAAGTSLFAANAAALSAPAPTSAGAAIVVGVSHNPGLGYAVAQRFAEGGMKVGIIGRQETALKACKAAILAEVPGADVEYRERPAHLGKVEPCPRISGDVKKGCMTSYTRDQP